MFGSNRLGSAAYLVGAVLLLQAQVAGAYVVNASFVAGPEQWAAAGNGSAPLTWDASGVVAIEDASDGWAYFAAPMAFLSPIVKGAMLSFDLRTMSDTQHSVVSPVRVALVGNGITIVAEHGLPTILWQHHEFVFDASDSWRILPGADSVYSPFSPAPTDIQWSAVLGSLNSLYISADYSSANALRGGFERTELDNVQLIAEPAISVPEPGSFALFWIAGLALVRSLRREKSKSGNRS